jgi:hypothetical protein
MVLSQSTIKQRILNYVDTHPGCNIIEITTKSDILGEDHSLDVPALLERCIDSGELIEIQRVMSAKPLRTQSRFYPQIKLK